MESVAIVGSGIAGLGCTYLLDDCYRITVFEQNAYLGGHTNTLDLQGKHQTFPVDTGFMVFNEVTYPNLLRFFKELDIAYYPTDMSFSVRHVPRDIEWNGSGLLPLFSQRRNLLNPKFLKMLGEMDRFCKEARTDVDSGRHEGDTVADYIQQKGYGNDFLDLFLVPMGSAIWSTSADNMLDFPIRTLIRFFLNHGFLGLDTHFQWYTVQGGARTYVEKLRPLLKAEFVLNCPVTRVVRQESGVTLRLGDGSERTFDKVIMASHADQTLALLDNPRTYESKWLSPFQYEKNIATIHTDTSVMPNRKRCWAAWNYRLEHAPTGKLLPSTHYWMNRLQSIPDPAEYFVSINATGEIPEEKIHRVIPYDHPLFSMAAVNAQRDLPEINRQSADQRLYFCGSYFKYGFHEDAFTSAVNLSKELSGGHGKWG